MSRPRKNNADWFSHDTGFRDNMKIKAVRARFGLEGYAVSVMILEVLSDAENFALKIDEFGIEMLAGDFRIDPEKLKNILNYFQEIEFLQEDDGKIFSKHLIERMDPLLSKRENMRQKHHEKMVSASETQVPKEETTPPAPPKKPKAEFMSEEDFETFWLQYPVKEDKKKSMEKFLKLEKSLLPKILESVKQHKIRSDKWIKGFPKMATTWINGECWNNELPPLQSNHKENAKSYGNSKQGRVSTEGSADLVV